MNMKALKHVLLCWIKLIVSAMILATIGYMLFNHFEITMSVVFVIFIAFISMLEYKAYIKDSND